MSMKLDSMWNHPVTIAQDAGNILSSNMSNHPGKKGNDCIQKTVVAQSIESVLHVLLEITDDLTLDRRHIDARRSDRLLEDCNLRDALNVSSVIGGREGQFPICSWLQRS
jgi:hypothetical protein